MEEGFVKTQDRASSAQVERRLTTITPGLFSRQKLCSCTWQPFEVFLHFTDNRNALNVVNDHRPSVGLAHDLQHMSKVYQPCVPHTEPSPVMSILTGTSASTWPASVSVLFPFGRSPSPREVLAEPAAAAAFSSLCSCLQWWSLVRSCHANWPLARSGWTHAGIWPAGWSPF